MPESALWGQVRTLIDNAEPRTEPTEESAYVQPLGEGLAKPRGFGRFAMSNDKEPYAVWILVVGAIALLFLMQRGFRTVKA